MSLRRERIGRVLPRAGNTSAGSSLALRVGTLRRLSAMGIDLRSLTLPDDVNQALAHAFSNHYGARPAHSALHSWHRLKVFANFIVQSRALGSLTELNGAVLVRYIEWLAQQRSSDGAPWSKSTQYA